jgi:hypothetical protein
MLYTEFQRRVDHNTSILQDTISSGKSIISRIEEFYTLNSKPGELHHLTIAQNYEDIVPSIYLGFLANLSTLGADALQVLANNHKVMWELKTSTVKSTQIKIGSRRGLYLQKDMNNPNSKTTITSYLAARYNISSEDNLASKNRKTAMLIADKDFACFDFIDAWCLEGDAVMDIISNNSGQIKFSVFRNYGTQLKTVVPLPGYDKWSQVIKNNLMRH